MKIYQSAFGICLIALLSACGGGDDVNTVPLSNAGTHQSVLTADVVQLDGSASSDADNDALTYLWSLTTKPAGSSATLSATGSAKPSFTADIAGSYVATLVVSDGQTASQPASVTIDAKASVASNIATVRKLFDNNDSKNFDANLQLLATDFIGYSSIAPNGVYRGNQAMVDFFRQTEGIAFPDGRHTIYTIFGADDYVAVDFLYSGIFAADLPPNTVHNNKKIDFHYHCKIRFEAGKIIEITWFSYDSYQLLQDLGVIAPSSF